MAGRYFGIPFATTGDKTVTPDAVQPDGSVSFSEGFGYDYERPNTDPAYKPAPRAGMNGLFHDITEAVGIIQKQGAADWTSAAAPYPINAFVRHNDIVWRNALAGNSAEPGTDSSWVNESIAFVDTINAPIATVAAASTINLTAGAPDTSQIAISGTGVTVNGFTVAANRFFVVRFSGANTLVNSGTLVTNTGANITTAAGDSCIIRATAANTVEILAYTPGIPQGLGYRQTIQVVTGSRAINTNYTNTTGRTILVMASINSASGTQPLVFVNEVIIGSWSNNGSGANINLIVFPVPAGATYRIGGGVSVGTWSELR